MTALLAAPVALAYLPEPNVPDLTFGEPPREEPQTDGPSAEGRATFWLEGQEITHDDPGRGSQKSSVNGPYGDTACSCRERNWWGACVEWRADGYYETRHTDFAWNGGNSHLETQGTGTELFAYDARDNDRYACEIKLAGSKSAAHSLARVFKLESFDDASGESSGYARPTICIDGTCVPDPALLFWTVGTYVLQGAAKSFDIWHEGDADSQLLLGLGGTTYVCASPCLVGHARSIF